MFDQDIIFRRHAEEKLDPKDQPTSVETKNQDHPGFIHHPSGNFYFASINERQPRVPFEVLHFSSNYYRRENGVNPDWKITDPVITQDDGEVMITEEEPETTTPESTEPKDEQTDDINEPISTIPNPPTDDQIPSAVQSNSEVEDKVAESPAEMTKSPIPA